MQMKAMRVRGCECEDLNEDRRMQQVQSYGGIMLPQHRAALTFSYCVRVVGCLVGGVRWDVWTMKFVVGRTSGWCVYLGGTDASEAPTARPAAFGVNVVAMTAEGQWGVDQGLCDDQGSIYL